LSTVGTYSDIPANFNSDSDLRTAEHQQELSENIALLLESNQSLSRRLMNLEDAFEVRTLISKRQSRAISTTDNTNDDISKPHQLYEATEHGTISKSNNISQLSTPPEGIEVSSFDFENDLERSRVYQRAQRDTMDFSFRSSIAHTNAWSQFSGFSLSKVSIISAIALPLYPDEIENDQHYISGGQQAKLSTESTFYAPRVRPLYQNCLELQMQLSQIPGLPEILAMERDENEDANPLYFVIGVFRRGVPLLLLLERVRGVQYLAQLTQFHGPIDSQKMPKVATFRFIKACMDDLGFHPDECFLIDDLFGDDTTGHVKVKTVSAICIGRQDSDPII
jgi:cell division control protein 24